MKTMQITFWDEDSASYEYFETEKTDIQEIKEEAIDVIQKKYEERWVKTWPFSLWLYMYEKYLVREYKKWKVEWWTEFSITVHEI